MMKVNEDVWRGKRWINGGKRTVFMHDGKQQKDGKALVRGVLQQCGGVRLGDTIQNVDGLRLLKTLMGTNCLH